MPSSSSAQSTSPTSPSRRVKMVGLALVLLGLGGLAFVQLGGLSLFGQRLEERQTSFFKNYDGWWDLVCDAKMDGSNEHCYLQYVDVYSPRPDFRAAMVELTYSRDEAGKSQPHLLFNLEGDLSFRQTRMVVRDANQVETPLALTGCDGAACSIRGDAAKAMLAEWSKGQNLQIELIERDGQPKQLSWPLGNIPEILQVLAEQRQARNVP